MAPTLHTARLLLTPVGEPDLPALHAHWNDPQVARWLWDAEPVPLQTVADVIARSTLTFEQSGWGLWALRPARAAPLIGVCSLSPFDHAPGAVELLYSLDPTQWSRGLATEAATAVVAYAFDVLTLPEILATTDHANAPSIRTLTRLGALPTPRLRAGPSTYPCYRLRPQPPQVCSFRAPVAQWIEQRTSNP